MPWGYAAAFHPPIRHVYEKLLDPDKSPVVIDGLPIAGVAQLVEQLIRNQQVRSSNLRVGSNKIKGLWHQP